MCVYCIQYCIHIHCIYVYMYMFALCVRMYIFMYIFYIQGQKRNKNHNIYDSILMVGLLLFCHPTTIDAAAWTVAYGVYTFSGDTTGAPLVKSGSGDCDTSISSLSLSNKGITSIPAGTLDGLDGVCNLR